MDTKRVQLFLNNVQCIAMIMLMLIVATSVTACGGSGGGGAPVGVTSNSPDGGDPSPTPGPSSSPSPQPVDFNSESQPSIPIVQVGTSARMKSEVSLDPLDMLLEMAVRAIVDAVQTEPIAAAGRVRFGYWAVVQDTRRGLKDGVLTYLGRDADGNRNVHLLDPEGQLAFGDAPGEREFLACDSFSDGSLFLIAQDNSLGNNHIRATRVSLLDNGDNTFGSSFPWALTGKVVSTINDGNGAAQREPFGIVTSTDLGVALYHESLPNLGLSVAVLSMATGDVLASLDAFVAGGCEIYDIARGRNGEAFFVFQKGGDTTGLDTFLGRIHSDGTLGNLSVAIVPLSNGNGDAFRPRLAVGPNGNPVTAWVDKRDGSPKPYRAEHTANLAVLVAPEVVDDVVVQDQDRGLDVDVDGSNVTTILYDATGAGKLRMRQAPSAGTLGSIEDLDTTTTDQRALPLVISNKDSAPANRGRVSAFWNAKTNAGEPALVYDDFDAEGNGIHNGTNPLRFPSASVTARRKLYAVPILGPDGTPVSGEVAITHEELGTDKAPHAASRTQTRTKQNP